MMRCLEIWEPIQRFSRKLRAQKLSADSDKSAEYETKAEAAYNPLTDFLTDGEWDETQELADFLEAPFQLMRRLEGSNGVSGFGSLWQVLLNLQALWNHYSEASKIT